MNILATLLANLYRRQDTRWQHDTNIEGGWPLLGNQCCNKVLTCECNTHPGKTFLGVPRHTHKPKPHTRNARHRWQSLQTQYWPNTLLWSSRPTSIRDLGPPSHPPVRPRALCTTKSGPHYTTHKISITLRRSTICGSQNSRQTHALDMNS